VASLPDVLAPTFLVRTVADVDAAERVHFTRMYEEHAPRVYRFLRDLLREVLASAKKQSAEEQAQAKADQKPDQP